MSHKDPPYHRKYSGMYILLADDTEAGYHTDNAAWQPLLHPYQQVSRLCPIFTNRSQDVAICCKCCSIYTNMSEDVAIVV